MRESGKSLSDCQEQQHIGTAKKGITRETREKNL